MPLAATVLEGLSTHYVSCARHPRRRARSTTSRFALEAGETLGIVGESGSGKSTLALTHPAPAAAGGAHRRRPHAASRARTSRDKSDAEMRRVRGKRIAMILQDPMASLNPLFTIGDQVAEPIRVHEGMPRRGALGSGRASC